MNEVPAWTSLIVACVGAVGTLVTAVATFFLWRVTKLLARETERMAEATAQPHVVVTLTPNRWSMRHFDIHVDNTGNATAYDVNVAFDPPLENGELRRNKTEIPFQKVSVLKPGQRLSSYLSEYENLRGKRFAVEISWKRNTLDGLSQKNAYMLNMADHDAVTRLGDEPLVQIANHVKKLEENWSRVARGATRAKVDVFTGLDRLRERRDQNRQRQRLARQHQGTAPESLPSGEPDR